VKIEQPGKMTVMRKDKPKKDRSSFHATAQESAAAAFFSCVMKLLFAARQLFPGWS